MDWLFDGQYLWLAVAGENNPGVDSIYQIDLGLPPVVSVDEEEKVIGIKVFPNPVDEVLYFDLDFVGSNTVIGMTIYDSLGKRIRSQSLEGKITSVQVDDLPAGTYIFTLKTENEFIQAGQFVVF